MGPDGQLGDCIKLHSQAQALPGTFGFSTRFVCAYPVGHAALSFPPKATSVQPFGTT